MLTTNYRQWMRTLFQHRSISGFIDVTGTNRTIDASGSYFDGSYAYSPGYALRYARCNDIATATDGVGGVYFGTGATPPAMSDYTLENPITSGLSIVNPGSQPGAHVDESEGTTRYQSIFSVTNTTDSEITISEAGLFVWMNVGTSSASSNKHCYLMDRVVLDEPIVLAAGETKAITYKMVFNTLYI